MTAIAAMSGLPSFLMSEMWASRSLQAPQPQSAGSGGHIGSKIYRLVDGRWQRIPGSSTMRAGEACWIHAADDSRFDGPLSLEFTSHVVDFGPNGSTLTLNAVNRSASPRTITVEAVTAGSSVAGAGVEIG